MVGKMAGWWAKWLVASEELGWVSSPPYTYSSKEPAYGTSLAIQWLRLCIFNAEGAGLIAG